MKTLQQSFSFFSSLLVPCPLSLYVTHVYVLNCVLPFLFCICHSVFVFLFHPLTHSNFLSLPFLSLWLSRFLKILNYCVDLRLLEITLQSQKDMGGRLFTYTRTRKVCKLLWHGPAVQPARPAEDFLHKHLMYVLVRGMFVWTVPVVG